MLHFALESMKAELIKSYCLRNRNNLTVVILNLGGIIQTLKIPNREGNLVDVVLGYDTFDSYVDHPYDCFGATIGRVAGRVTDGKFTMDGQIYTLAKNHGTFHLHGGEVGFDQRIWKSEPYTIDGEEALRLQYLSPDGEEGYPGNLDVQVHYCLTHDNTLRIKYFAKTDKRTPLAMTNHSYFNLNGEGSGAIRDHFLKIHSDEIVQVDEDMGHLGIKKKVDGTPDDFRFGAKIGERLDRLHNNHGAMYVNDNQGNLKRMAELFGQVQGIKMDVWTTAPFTQVYMGEHLQVNSGKGGKRYHKFSGICLECQRYPDAPNHPDFANNFLEPGELFEHQTEYRFSSLDR